MLNERCNDIGVGLNIWFDGCIYPALVHKGTTVQLSMALFQSGLAFGTGACEDTLRNALTNVWACLLCCCSHISCLVQDDCRRSSDTASCRCKICSETVRSQPKVATPRQSLGCLIPPTRSSLAAGTLGV